MAKIQKKAVPKGKKKKWYKIVAPKSFNNQELGESFVFEPSQMMGKHINVNLMTLLRDPKKQNTNLTFKVTRLEGDKAMTSTVSLTIIPAFMKRIVRRGKNRVDMSFLCKTKDKTVRVKPIILTRSLTHKPVQSALRKEAHQMIVDTFKGYTFDNLIRDLIAYKVQLKIKKDLSKVYPLKSFDIRIIKEEKLKRRGGSADEEIDVVFDEDEETEATPEQEETTEEETSDEDYDEDSEDSEDDDADDDSEDSDEDSDEDSEDKDDDIDEEKK